jgi:hypothetical protein
MNQTCSVLPWFPTVAHKRQEELLASQQLKSVVKTLMSLFKRTPFMLTVASVALFTEMPLSHIGVIAFENGRIYKLVYRLPRFARPPAKTN